MEQDCEYYRNIVERMTGVLAPHILEDTNSLPAHSDSDSDMDLDELADNIEYVREGPVNI